VKALYLALGRDLTAKDAGTTHTLSIVRGLTALGVEITLVARDTTGAPEGVRTIDMSLPKKLTLRPPVEVIDRLLRKAGNVHVIHERSEESGGVGVKLAEAIDRPLVLEVNTPLSGHPSPIVRKIADWNLRRQARAADAIITQTLASRHIIEGYSRRPVYVIPNGADPDVFRPDAPPIAIPDAEGRSPVITFAGSLRPWHGVADLVEAAAHILTAHRNALFVFVGGGERLESFEALAAEKLPEGSYHFTGPVEPEDVPSYLAAADLLVAPFSPGSDPVRAAQFRSHGMWWSPVKIFEYMAMGKPIVACSAGPVAEYLTHSGVTVPPGDTVALARAAARLLDDPELSETLGSQARERLVENYTWRHAAENTLAAWKEVLARFQNASATRNSASRRGRR
jgi:glycosyltransferase involved in cell wall biosynthesis